MASVSRNRYCSFTHWFTLYQILLSTIAINSDGTKALVTPTAMEIGEVYAELALIQHVAHREEILAKPMKERRGSE